MSIFETDTEDLDILFDQLEHPDATTRRVAILALADCGHEDAAAPLIRRLNDIEPDLRAEAAKALGNFHLTCVAPALVQALHDPVAAVREAAATALPDVVTQQHEQVLLAAAVHPTPFVQAVALRALIPLRTPAAFPVAAAALTGTPDTAPDTGSDTGTDTRRAAAALLGWLRTEAAGALLVQAARTDPDSEVRRTAIGALTDGPDVEATIRHALSDPSWHVREVAAQRAGRLGLRAALPELAQAMTDDYWQVRVKAAAALGQPGLTEAIPILAPALSSPISTLRKEAAAALGAIGDSAAVPLLEELVNDPDPEVRKLTRKALAELARIT
ncbi:MAG: HEAT repeat domain-containing protein [Acetobacter sp.]|uniref:HEAT repeat domain-containing protein n=1 Tax=Acetobacter sp. TaxID=440 RepID=UPI0039E810CB